MPFPIKTALSIIVLLVALAAYFYQGLDRPARAENRDHVPGAVHGRRDVDFSGSHTKIDCGGPILTFASRCGRHICKC